MTIDILSSIHTAYALQLSRRTEQNYLCASDYLAASLDQLFQVNLTLNTLNMISREMGQGSLSIKTRNLLVLSPLIPATLTYVKMNSYWAKKSVIWVSEHYGFMTRVVNMLGVGLLFLYGRHFVAIASLTTYTFSYLSEQKYLSEKVSKIVDAAIVIPIDIYFLFYGSAFDRLLSLFELAARVKHISDAYEKKQPTSLAASPTKRHGADIFSLQDLMGMSLDKVQLDLSHLEHKPFSSGTGQELPFKYCESSLSVIEQAFDAISWDNHLMVLLKKLAKDKHWNDPPTLPEDLFPLAQELNILVAQQTLSIEDEKRMDYLINRLKPHAIQFFKEGLHILTARLRAKSAEVRKIKGISSDPIRTVRQKRHSIINLNDLSDKDYIYQVEGFYQAIAHFLKKKESEMDRANALLWLGVEGADYCGSQFCDVLREAEASLAEIGKDIALENGILNILYERRLHYIQNAWGKVLSFIPHALVERLGLNSPHWPNIILALYGKELKAETIGSESDIEAQATVTEGFAMLMTPLTSIFQYSFFSKVYTKENIVEWVQEEIQAGRIAPMMVQNWFQENMQLTEFDDIWKEDYSSITDKAIILMLVKMRIFDRLLRPSS